MMCSPISLYIQVDDIFTSQQSMTLEPQQQKC